MEHSEDYERECKNKFPKIWRHSHRDELERMVDAGVLPGKISEWTYTLSREKGIDPGNASPISISYLVMCQFVKFRKEYVHQTDLPVPDESASLARALRKTAEERKVEALATLDKIIEKGLKQLEAGEKVSQQTVLQALQLRQQLETGTRIEVTLSVEVRTIIQQIVQVVNRHVDSATRVTIAQEVARLPALRAIDSGETDQNTDLEVIDGSQDCSRETVGSPSYPCTASG